MNASLKASVYASVLLDGYALLSFPLTLTATPTTPADKPASAVHPYTKGLAAAVPMIDKTRPNALFLSIVAQFDGEIAQSVLDWFRTMLRLRGTTSKGVMARFHSSAT